MNEQTQEQCNEFSVLLADDNEFILIDDNALLVI